MILNFLRGIGLSSSSPFDVDESSIFASSDPPSASSEYIIISPSLSLSSSFSDLSDSLFFPSLFSGSSQRKPSSFNIPIRSSRSFFLRYSERWVLTHLENFTSVGGGPTKPPF